jgi:hypothetical protein
MTSPQLHPLFVAASAPEADYDRSQDHSTSLGFVRDPPLGIQRVHYARETFPLIRPCCVEIYKVWRGCWEKLPGLMLHEALKMIERV